VFCGAKHALRLLLFLGKSKDLPPINFRVMESKAVGFVSLLKAYGFGLRNFNYKKPTTQGEVAGLATASILDQIIYSRKSRRRRLRRGWRSLPRALASICRMRSRVTPNFRPTSSRV